MDVDDLVDAVLMGSDLEELVTLHACRMLLYGPLLSASAAFWQKVSAMPEFQHSIALEELDDDSEDIAMTQTNY
ncbi:hypothetical protein ACJ6YJ_18400 [Pseudomonas marginalis]|uniref:hypothetical protein n=1 Tax=Pseudomonas TaxID=286 RepID=UPI00389AA7BE